MAGDDQMLVVIPQGWQIFIIDTVHLHISQNWVTARQQQEGMPSSHIYYQKNRNANKAAVFTTL